jgi:hypothetical protein
MLRTIAFAVSFAVLSSQVLAAPQRQLIAPNLNPALRTVPSIPHTYLAGGDDASCERQLVTRIDSGTVIPGPDGRVAHIMGMAEGASDATLMITSISADGLSATADFLACTSSTWLTPAPVTAIMPVSDARLETIAVRTRTNTLTVKTR